MRWISATEWSLFENYCLDALAPELPPRLTWWQTFLPATISNSSGGFYSGLLSLGERIVQAHRHISRAGNRSNRLRRQTKHLCDNVAGEFRIESRCHGP